jgi:hypothetical protein
MALRAVDCVLPPLYLLKEYLTFFTDALVRSQVGDSPALPVNDGENPDGDELCVFDVLAVLPQFVVEVTVKK